MSYQAVITATLNNYSSLVTYEYYTSGASDDRADHLKITIYDCALDLIVEEDSTNILRIPVEG